MMPFSLKNVRATYQKIMNKVFKNQIRRNLEVYVNDMLIKSRSLKDHLEDLEENVLVVKHNKIRINLAKCAFRVTAEKILGFMLTKKGIEVSLTKCKAILEMRSLTIVKEVQILNGWITVLS